MWERALYSMCIAASLHWRMLNICIFSHRKLIVVICTDAQRISLLFNMKPKKKKKALLGKFQVKSIRLGKIWTEFFRRLTDTSTTCSKVGWAVIYLSCLMWPQAIEKANISPQNLLHIRYSSSFFCMQLLIFFLHIILVVFLKTEWQGKFSTRCWEAEWDSWLPHFQMLEACERNLLEIFFHLFAFSLETEFCYCFYYPIVLMDPMLSKYELWV